MSKKISESQHDASRLLRAELMKRNVTSAMLSARLTLKNKPRSAGAIDKTIHRGSFATSFFMDCMDAIDVDTMTTASILKSKLIEKGLKYKDLSDKLKGIGVMKSPDAIKQALYRKPLSKKFAMQCTTALNFDKEELRM